LDCQLRLALPLSIPDVADYVPDVPPISPQTLEFASFDGCLREHSLFAPRASQFPTSLLAAERGQVALELPQF